METVELTKVKTDRLYYEVDAKYLDDDISGKYVPLSEVEKMKEEYDAEIANEKDDVAKADYSISYERGIYEGMRLAEIILREQFLKEQA